MGARNQEQTRGRIGPQLRLGNLRVGELHFCPPCTALDQASSLSRKLAYVPGPTFGFVKLLASSGSHCTKWADEQHRQAGFESRLLPDLPLPFIPTLIGLRAFDLVSSRVWWEAATNIGHLIITLHNNHKLSLHQFFFPYVWRGRHPFSPCTAPGTVHWLFFFTYLPNNKTLFKMFYEDHNRQDKSVEPSTKTSFI